MIEVFQPVIKEVDSVPRVIRFRTPENERVVVELGRTYGLPATRFLVRDSRGRTIREGGSVGVSFEIALTAGLGQQGFRGKALLDHYSGSK